MSGPPSNLALRWTTALVVLPVVLVLIWLPAFFPGYAFGPEPAWPRLGLAALVGFVALTALHEFNKLLRAREIPTSEPAAQAGALLIIAAGWLAKDVTLLNVAMLVAVIAACFASVALQRTSAAGMCGIFAGLVYTVWCPAHVLLIQSLEGPDFVMLLAIVVVLTDTAAYFTGRAIGKHPLAAVISPKKTWEGAIGGLVAGVLGAVAYGEIMNHIAYDVYYWPAWRFAVTGAALSIVAQLSDLVKSSVKRDAGVKDSGHLLPGHGGALDRFDGFLFAAPVLYYMSMF